MSNKFYVSKYDNKIIIHDMTNHDLILLVKYMHEDTISLKKIKLLEKGRQVDFILIQIILVYLHLEIKYMDYNSRFNCQNI